jgi:response regulator RpfG family c-di-GMP phosphodiesterase
MDEQLATTSPYRPTVLLVDDEESILNSLRRLLRGQPYDVLLAGSGAQALEIMAAQPVDLVMTDARMPAMDGATLLAETHRLYPATSRILLTGYADLTMIIKAINEGQIHRYISKPWNDDELLLILRQSLEHQFSDRERLRLEQLTREQNDQLKALNATLEKRVLSRTSELQQTADMLDLAYDELKRSYVTGTEVFSLLANLRLPKEKQTNRPLIELIRVYCRAQSMDESSVRDLTMAAALYNVGKLSWTDRMMIAPADLLHSTDRELYRTYPTQSESLLMTPGADEGCGAHHPPSPGALGRQWFPRPPQGRWDSVWLAFAEVGGGLYRIAARLDSGAADEQRRSAAVHPQIRRAPV